MITDGRTNKFIDDDTSDYGTHIDRGLIVCSFIGILFAAFFIFVLFVSRNEAIEREHAVQNKWNDGICTECGGDYEFFQAVGHSVSTSYIYKCDSCGKIVEFENIMEKEN